MTGLDVVASPILVGNPKATVARRAAMRRCCGPDAAGMLLGFKGDAHALFEAVPIRLELQSPSAILMNASSPGV